ncbi:hypothetical protein [Heyndrickxia acidicola]|uniref:hypothetical protein n=1 Tax=Heyndrickxia acidicola TaxID=209389 RepID=UPI0008270445|nr:hypothetical protein [Heyndrickxia acidicola]
MYLDPTFHIIDTKDNFIITTGTVNLKFKITNQQKEKIYSLVRSINENNYRSVLSKENKTFESKIIKLFKDKKILLESNDTRILNPVLDSSEFSIQAPQKILSILKNENFPVSLNNENEWKIYVFEEAFYISNQKIETMEFTSNIFNDVLNTYAAYVFLEKVKNSEIRLKTQKDLQIYKIDLLSYKNNITKIVGENIDKTNFFYSTFSDERLSEYYLSWDFEKYFPLICAQYKNEKNAISVLGTDKNDCINNLLVLLKDVYTFSNKIQYFVDEYKWGENYDYFFSKFCNLYFSHKITIYDEAGFKVFDSMHATIKFSQNNIFNPYTLYISLLENNLFECEEINIYGMELLRKVKEYSN